jgi:hypothetical protein
MRTYGSNGSQHEPNEAMKEDPMINSTESSGLSAKRTGELQRDISERETLLSSMLNDEVLAEPAAMQRLLTEIYTLKEEQKRMVGS